MQVHVKLTLTVVYNEGDDCRLKAFSGILEIFKQELFSGVLDKQAAGKHWIRMNRGTGSGSAAIVNFHFENPCRRNLQPRVEPCEN